ncbi:MAG: UDP-N-acetylmuramoyl-L-alanyl-D-glutamate--2,6-diaminopimelate ligase [Actinobacteria bacterium]|nr:UDP-N-acetylmuramoyl-L-alanyl-D-glutamate--2,6-diaminopimelate ligase [Actinomycetota bacterium]
MNLNRLIKSLSPKEIKGNIDLDIRGIAYNSNKVKPGDLFVCIKGFKDDGHLYAEDALTNGAVAFIVERPTEGLKSSQIVVESSRKALAVASNIFFGFPSSRLELIGVTGTNGKTTTVYMIDSILKAAGKKTGLLGTIEYRIDNKFYPSYCTTPESLDLQIMFDEMLKQKVDSVVMEVTSHAIDLERVTGCQFRVLVFTNLSQDHLDYHENVENYFKVKSRIFKNSANEIIVPNYVINIDDFYGREIAKMVGMQGYFYGLNTPADITVSDINLTKEGTSFKTTTPKGPLFVKMRLKGVFNVYNALGAIGAGLSLGISLKDIKLGLEAIRLIPGRFEPLDYGQEFNVIIDYAHTPASLENVLKTIRRISDGRIITIFGCGGDRDKGKRPLMGAIAAELSDFFIITSDNPRSEDPMEIIDQIEGGFIEEFPKARYCKIADRRDAIFQAVALAKNGDTVIIAGKGHEQGQIFVDRIVPFDDHQVAYEALKELMRCSL